MTRRRKVWLGVIATLALTLTATPAFASTWDGGNIQWGSDVDDFWGVSNVGEFNFSGVSTDAWASSFSRPAFISGLEPYELVGDTPIARCASAYLSDATDGSGDKILTCDSVSENLDGTSELSVTMEMRFFADHQTARQRLILTNNNATAVTGATITVYNQYWQSSFTNLSYTPTMGNRLSNWPTGNTSDDDILTEADNVFVTDSPEGAGGPGVTSATVYQAFGLGALEPSFFADPVNYTLGGDASTGSAADETWFGYDIPELAPGESVSVVSMVRSYLFLEGVDNDATVANALAASTSAVAFAEAGGWDCDGQVTAGIANPETIINYACEAPAVPPTLVRTGVSTPAPVAVGLAAGSALVLLMGAALVAIRRRTLQ